MDMKENEDRMGRTLDALEHPGRFTKEELEELLKGTDLSELPSGERDVLTLLAVRLLCATTQVHRFEAVTAILDCQGYTFTAKGKTILQSGWKEVERIHRMSIRQSETEHKENEAVALPVLQEGQTFEAVSASLREGKTSPPKHYTDVIFCERKEWIGIEERSSA